MIPGILKAYSDPYSISTNPTDVVVFSLFQTDSPKTTRTGCLTDPSMQAPLEAAETPSEAPRGRATNQ
jgi:hypothetical protein